MDEKSCAKLLTCVPPLIISSSRRLPPTADRGAAWTVRCAAFWPSGVSPPPQRCPSAAAMERLGPLSVRTLEGLAHPLDPVEDLHSGPVQGKSPFQQGTPQFPRLTGEVPRQRFDLIGIERADRRTSNLALAAGDVAFALKRLEQPLSHVSSKAWIVHAIDDQWDQRVENWHGHHQPFRSTLALFWTVSH